MSTTDNSARPASRIPLLEPEDMTPEQLAAYNSSPNSKINLSRLLANAPTLAPKFTEFNMTMAREIEIPNLEREIVCLATLHLDRGEYEWAQHMEVAKIMGIPQEKVDAIAAERFNDPVFTDRERALLAFTRQVVKSVRVEDCVFNAVAAFYSPRQMVEILFVIGNYMMVLRISEAAELVVDSVDGANFWKDQKKAD